MMDGEIIWRFGAGRRGKEGRKEGRGVMPSSNSSSSSSRRRRRRRRRSMSIRQ